jgi:hypothetical protein
MELEIPQPRIARRSSRTKMGHFVGDVGHDGFAHFLATYRTGMAGLPPFQCIVRRANEFRYGARLPVRRARERLSSGRTSAGPQRLHADVAAEPAWRAEGAYGLLRRPARRGRPFGSGAADNRPRRSGAMARRDDRRPRTGCRAPDGVSIGGWTATNCAYLSRQPSQGRCFSWRSRSAAPQGVALDRGRRRRRRFGARGRADLRGLQ